MKRDTVLAELLIMAMLGLAMIPTMPYGYYGVMRWVVCAAFLLLAFRGIERAQGGWVWIWFVSAGIYNPIVKFGASREVWMVVNLITLAVVVWWLVAARRRIS